jgi:hypothetical protein
LFGALNASLPLTVNTIVVGIGEGNPSAATGALTSSPGKKPVAWVDFSIG